MKFCNLTIQTEKQGDKHLALCLLPILFLFFLSFTLPQKGWSQSFNPLISFSVESCSLDKALEKLFAEYELNVAFSKAELSKIHIEKYSCSYKSVEEVLADLLKGTDYGFKKIGKQYVIRKNQQLVNDPSATITPPAEQQTAVVVPKQEIVPNKEGDTIYIFDTLKVIRTVMRYDTVVEVKQEIKTDTVYEVRYESPQQPQAKDNGWFITPSLTMSSVWFKHTNGLPQPENGTLALTPGLVYAIGVDGGYKYKRLNVGLNLSYRSVRYRFLLENTEYGEGYYVNDTLDTYYTVHPAGDTAFFYVVDSVYTPGSTTHYAYRDVNRLDYLNVGVFATYDFVKLERFRAFVKAGISLDFLVGYGGSLYTQESPYHVPIEKSQVELFRFSYYGGLGFAFKVANSVELVPEVLYRGTSGSLYRADFPFDMKMRAMDFRLGLTYSF